MPNPYTSQALTKKQSRILNFIKNYFIDEQSMPTLQDISNNFGWSSANAAAVHISALKKKGFLIERPGKTPAYKMAYVKIKIEGVY